jgi:hypothetical protein
VIDRAYLTLLVGPTIPLPAPQPVVDALQSAQITIAADQRSGFQLVFAISRESLITRVLHPAGYFDPNVRVIVVATVNGLPSVLMDGIIIRQEMTPSNDLGKATLTVTGEDVSLAMSLNEIKGIPFPVIPENLIVMALLAKYLIYGIIPAVLPPIFPDVNPPTDKMPFQQGTDLEYIQYLAKKVGYVFYIIPGPVPGTNTAYWGPEIRVGIPQPALNINMDASSNVENLSFSMDGSSREQVAVGIQEPITKMMIPIPLPDITPLSPPLAIRQAPALRYKYLEGTAKLNPLKAMAKALAAVSKSADAVTASGQLDVMRYGRVLQARQLVGVRGAGLGYDGLYYVKSVTHNINCRTGEYKQSFQMARNGLVSITPAVPA